MVFRFLLKSINRKRFDPKYESNSNLLNGELCNYFYLNLVLRMGSFRLRAYPFQKSRSKGTARVKIYAKILSKLPIMPIFSSF